MTGDAAGHAHAWSAMRFELVDGHPYVLETCSTCGADRRYRAFERSWDPAGAAPPGPPRPADGASNDERVAGV